MHCQFIILDDISFPIVVGTDGVYQREGVVLLGLLDPATSDGHVILFLPWQGEKWLVRKRE